MKRAKRVWSNSCFYVLREWGCRGWVYTIYDYWWESFWMGFPSLAEAVRWCEDNREVRTLQELCFGNEEVKA